MPSRYIICSKLKPAHGGLWELLKKQLFLQEVLEAGVSGVERGDLAAGRGIPFTVMRKLCLLPTTGTCVASKVPSGWGN